MRSAVAAAAAALALLITPAPAAHADPDDDPGTGQEVCGGFNLGLSPDQIAQGQRNDRRINEWQAQRDTNWPIIDGDCG